MTHTETQYAAHVPVDDVRIERLTLLRAFLALQQAMIARNILQHPNYQS